VLEQLATSPDLGAPARVAHAQGGVIRPSDDRSSASAALSAVVTAAGEGGGRRGLPDPRARAPRDHAGATRVGPPPQPRL